MVRDHPVALRRAKAGACERSAVIAAAWRDNAALREIVAALGQPANADAEEVVGRAEVLLGDGDLVARLIAPLVAALAADPFFDPPFKVHRDAQRIGAALVDLPAARVSASVTSALTLARQPMPRTVVVPGCFSVTRYVRAGGARFRRWDAGRAGGDFRASAAVPAQEIASLTPANGEVVVHDGRRTGYVTTGAVADIVAVSVLVRASPDPLMREYVLADGALVRATTTDDGASRGAMLLTLLRLSGRTDAGELFDAASRGPGFHARWGAMREWLALDADAALSRLAEMAAGDPHPEVRAAAAATLGVATRQREALCPA